MHLKETEKFELEKRIEEANEELKALKDDVSKLPYYTISLDTLNWWTVLGGLKEKNIKYKANCV